MWFQLGASQAVSSVAYPGYAPVAMTALAGLSTAFGAALGVLLLRRSDVDEKYRRRVAAAKARVRVQKYHPALRDLFLDLVHGLNQLSITISDSVPPDKFAAVVDSTNCAKQISVLSDFLFEEGDLDRAFDDAKDAYSRMARWWGAATGWPVIGLLALLTSPFWPSQLETLVGAVFVLTELSLLFICGYLLMKALRSEKSLDEAVSNVERGT